MPWVTGPGSLSGQLQGPVNSAKLLNQHLAASQRGLNLQDAHESRDRSLRMRGRREHGCRRSTTVSSSAPRRRSMLHLPRGVLCEWESEGGGVGGGGVHSVCVGFHGGRGLFGLTGRVWPGCCCPGGCARPRSERSVPFWLLRTLLLCAAIGEVGPALSSVVLRSPALPEVLPRSSGRRAPRICRSRAEWATTLKWAGMLSVEPSR